MSAARDPDVWAAVDRWVDAAPLTSDLLEHRLELLGARRLRELGRPVPPELLEAERDAAVVAMTAPIVLRRVREAVDDPIVLFKGLEIAALYPDPAMRTLHDLDLIVHDAPGVQDRLIAAGFGEVGVPELYEGIHHLRPLQWPGLPVVVEIHHSPKWLDWATPPPLDELFAAAISGTTRVPGVQTLAPSHHALVVAAHSWSNAPLGRLRDLLDAHLLAAEAPPGETAATARRWGLERIWRTTSAATDALIDPARRPRGPLLTWARNLRTARGRTVFEHHVERWTSGFCAMPPGGALRAAGTAVARDLRPDGEESWAEKGRRSARAMRAAGRRKAHHDGDEVERPGPDRQVPPS